MQPITVMLRMDDFINYYDTQSISSKLRSKGVPISYKNYKLRYGRLSIMRTIEYIIFKWTH